MKPKELEAIKKRWTKLPLHWAIEGKEIYGIREDGSHFLIARIEPSIPGALSEEFCEALFNAPNDVLWLIAEVERLRVALVKEIKQRQNEVAKALQVRDETSEQVLKLLEDECAEENQRLQKENQELEAQAATMRGVFKGIQLITRNPHLRTSQSLLGTCALLDQIDAECEIAMQTDAGRKLLEQIEKLEAVAKTAANLVYFAKDWHSKREPFGPSGGVYGAACELKEALAALEEESNE